MVGSGRKGKLTCVLVGLLIIIAYSPASAIPITLPSGKVIDITPDQVDSLKKSPGIYYFDHWPDKVLNENLRYWDLIELPQELGGGFIIGNPQNMAQALNKIDARELQNSEIAASLSSPEASEVKGRTPQQNPWQYTLNIGYRKDDLDWNIAGDVTGNNPNILSELTWSDIEIIQLEFGLARFFSNGVVLKGDIAYGFIFDGNNQDSDYFGDNRTLEFSRSNNSTDDGNTTDFSIALGYFLPLLTNNFSTSPLVIGATPLVGLSFHAQNLTITDGFQTIPLLGPFPGLNSSYDAKWYGPWAGIELNFRIHLVHEILFGGEYHWADYYGEANWNLRIDLAHPKSFEHEADGSGTVLWVGYNYFFNPKWSLSASYKYQKWETDPGIDRIFFADGTQIVTRLNEVNWESSAFKVGVTCRF